MSWEDLECADPTLRQAVCDGDLAKVEDLITSGKHNVNEIGERWCRPLRLAAARGNVKMCKLLLRLGADPCTSDEKKVTALMSAVGEKRPLFSFQFFSFRIVEMRAKNTHVLQNLLSPVPTQITT